MPTDAVVLIPAHCNGPPTSGNGGYSCGLLAAHIEGASRVRLQVPPPLETPLNVKREAEGLALYDGDTLVARAWPTQLDTDIPDAPTLEAAGKAASGYPGHRQHMYPGCYVCGPERTGDGLCIFPGPLPDSSLLACAWTPRGEMLDTQGRVRPEIVWAALDCPGYFAVLGEVGTPALLGELSVELLASVPGDESLVVYCWSLGVEGRKASAGSAIADASGRVLAHARSLWITLQEP